MNHHQDIIHQGDQASRPFLLFFDLTKVRLIKEMDQTKRHSGEKNLLCELDKKDESKRQRGEKLKYFSQSVRPSLLWQAALRPRFLYSTLKH